MKKLKIVNGNVLKLIALIAMTFDHIGVELMNDSKPLRIIGRVSFPLFAYMIAEGCRYTKNKKKHFFMIFLLGVGCQLVYYFAEKSLYMSILITFSLSVLLIYAYNLAKTKRKVSYYIAFSLSLGFVCFICEVLPLLIQGTGFKIDYGFFGVLLPLLISLSDNKNVKLAFTGLGLIPIALYLGGVQWYSFFALIPLALYNGQKGKRNLKYLFYIYYPLHLLIIFLIAEFVLK